MHGDIELIKYFFTDHYNLVLKLDKRTLLENAINGDKLENVIHIHEKLSGRSFIYVNFIIKSLLNNENKDMIKWLISNGLIKKDNMNLFHKHCKNKEFLEYVESFFK